MDSNYPGSSSPSTSKLCISPQASVACEESCISASMHSPSHNLNNVPNIFSQLDEFVKADQPDRTIHSKLPVFSAILQNKASVLSTQQSKASASSKFSDSVLCTSAMSSLHNVLNLSNVNTLSLSRDDKVDKLKATASDAKNFSQILEEDTSKMSDTDGENNEILFDFKSSCDVPLKKFKSGIDLQSDETVFFDDYLRLFQADRLRDMQVLNRSYQEHLTELFFLQNGGNLMDYYSWKKRPNTLLTCYLLSEKLDTEDIDELMDCSQIHNNSLSASSSTPSLQNIMTGSQHLMENIDSMPASSSGFASVHSNSFSNAESLTSTPVINRSISDKTSTPLGFYNISMLKSPPLSDSPISSFMKSSNVEGMHRSSSSMSGECTSQETIAELAKQEALVMEKITELRKKGLWATRRVQKAPEPSRCKAHWDYVMEEMQWLANDFAQERKGKKAGARKVARMIGRHFQDVQQRGLRAEKEETLKLKRIASSLAKMVKEFWCNIEKVVHYKQQSRIGEKRKKALDLHLSFIVDQTEKYSTWLTEGLGASLSQTKSSTCSSPAPIKDDEDGDFKPEDGSTDDEETIEKDEKLFDEEETKAELSALQKESEMPLEELIQMLPKEILEKKDVKKINEESDVESYAPSDEDTDDEETLDEEEQQEEDNHDDEISSLQQEGEMPIEELLKLYGGAFSEAPSPEVSVKNNRKKKKVPTATLR